MADDKRKAAKKANRKQQKSDSDVDHSRFMPKNPVDFPDFSEIDIPEADDEAIEALQKMDDVMRPLVVTPQEERYPPVPQEAQEKPVTQSRPKPIAPRPKHQRRNNFVTLLFILLTVGLCGYFSLIWTDPMTMLNPLAPPTTFMIVTATPDANPVFVPTEAPALPEDAPTPTPELDDLYPFAVAPDGILFVSNQNGRECNWASIAGSVTNETGSPLPGFGIRVSGDQVSATVYSGTNQTYGAGGYELNLGGAPMFANFRVQLVTTGGAPLSEEIVVTTRDDCNENVAIVNFVQR